ncbi:MAG: DUF1385 domain-containing protein [Candidatus Woesearchaeota archaeon]|jgi:uncharacterized protein YqhQ
MEKSVVKQVSGNSDISKDGKVCFSKVGGQAVIDGVMMRNKNKVAVSVRTSKGKIVSKTVNMSLLSDKYVTLKWPLIRGVYNLFSSMIIGMRTLMWSTNMHIEKEEEKISTKEMFITILISLVFAIGIFVLLPLFLTNLLVHKAGIFFNVVDGVFRVLFFIAYILLISLMPDVKRVFMYHGAEHKSIYCYEHKLPLTVKNAKRFSRLHPRCGTNFLVIVLFIMVFLHTFIVTDVFYEQFLLRIALLPIIAAISYEVLMFSAKYNNFFTRFVYNVGFLFQRLTTKEPDDKMIEVALTSLKLVVKDDKKRGDTVSDMS